MRRYSSMQYKKLVAFPLFALSALSLFVVASADEKIGPYQLIDTILIPGNLAGGFDISWVDSASERYYLAERTATANTGRIDVIDAEHDKFLYSIKGFVGTQPGSGTSGPDGCLAIHKENELSAGYSDTTVKVVDLNSRASAVPFAIHTGGIKR